jgi:hypothetical protein
LEKNLKHENKRETIWGKEGAHEKADKKNNGELNMIKIKYECIYENVKMKPTKMLFQKIDKITFLKSKDFSIETFRVYMYTSTIQRSHALFYLLKKFLLPPTYRVDGYAF